MGKSMVSCKFSLKPIHWQQRVQDYFSELDEQLEGMLDAGDPNAEVHRVN